LLGTSQGRLQTTGFTPDGTFAFVLGSDAPSVRELLNIGDKVELSQTVDVTGTKYIRFAYRGRPPASLPGGAAWKFSLLVAGVERMFALLPPGRTRDRADLSANVSKLTGNQSVVFRLEVVAA
jgi:hypothetical protein